MAGFDEPIDRERLLDAISSALPGNDDVMLALVVGGLQFLITGEAGVKLSDYELRTHAALGDDLTFLLIDDLDEAWQGISKSEMSRAWFICEQIAAAFCRFFREQGAV